MSSTFRKILNFIRFCNGFVMYFQRLSRDIPLPEEYFLEEEATVILHTRDIPFKRNPLEECHRTSFNTA